MPPSPPDHYQAEDQSAAPRLDYYAVLRGAIEQAEQDNAYVRALIYERARFNLKREALFGNSTLGVSEWLRHINELELAIAKIETYAIDGPAVTLDRDRLSAIGTNAIATRGTGAGENGLVQIMPPQPLPPLAASSDWGSAEFPARQDGKPAVPRTARLYALTALQMVGLALFAAVVVAGILIAGARWYAPKVLPQLAVPQPPAAPTSAAAPAPALPYPVPTSYGVYALADDRLFELQALQLRVPDPRIALSPEITKPSTVRIASTSPSFIVFRRDLVNNAPGKLAVRVVASVVRGTSYAGGKAVTEQIKDSWRIRNTLFELKVSPVPGHPEMIRAHGDDGFTLSAGRYVLVLGNLGYDFTVAGPMTSLSHCLERFESANGPMFTECRSL